MRFEIVLRIGDLKAYACVLAGYGALTAASADPHVLVDREIPVSFNVTGLAVDKNDSVFVAGNGTNDTYVYKISPQGEQTPWGGPFTLRGGNRLALDSGGNCFVLDWDSASSKSVIHRISASGELHTNYVNLGRAAYGVRAFTITPQDDICVAYVLVGNGGLGSAGLSGVGRGTLTGELTDLFTDTISGLGFNQWNYLASGPVNYLVTGESQGSYQTPYQDMVASFNSRWERALIATLPFSSITGVAADSRGTVYWSSGNGIYQATPDNPTNLFFQSASLQGLLTVDSLDRFYAVTAGRIVRLVEAPSITLPAPAVGENEGQTLHLDANVHGLPPLVCQWTREGTNLAGATNPSLTVANLQMADRGLYSLWASNAYGFATSYCRVEIVARSQFRTQVVGWGRNAEGQSQVAAGLTNAVAIAGGSTHSVALTEEGNVVAWGTNSYGVFTPTGVKRTYNPASVPAEETRAVALSAGDGNTAIISEDGSAGYWSDLPYFPAPFYKDDPYFQALKPRKPVLNLLFGGAQFDWGTGSPDTQWNLVLMDDGQLLGYQYPGGIFPQSASNSLTAASVAAYGSEHVITLNPNGTLAFWSFSNSQWLPAGNLYMGLSNVVAIAGGYQHCVALMRNGTVVAWGQNDAGQTNVPPDLTNAVAIAAGYAHTLALKADGTVAAWGANESGQTTVPAGLTHVIAIAAGFWHSLAITSVDPAFLAPPELRQLIFTNQTLSVSVPTVRGRSYVLEYRNALDEASWSLCPPIPGDGTIKTLQAPSSAASQRFFRVRKQ